MKIIMLFVILFACVSLSVPIGFALGLATLFCFKTYTSVAMTTVAQSCVTGLDSFPMMAIPFFIMAGIVMSKGGVAKRLVNMSMSFLGHFPGGLGMVTAVTCCIFGAISGSAAATVSAIGGFMIPGMIANGYPAGFAAALAAAAGIIGVIIPPSLSFVIYGVVSNTSITDMFIAGIVPGLMMTFALCIVCYFAAKKYQIPIAEKHSWNERFHSLWDAKWSLMAIVVILGGIYSGIFTPTEAAVVSVVYSIIIGMFVYKELSPSDLYDALKETMITNGMIMFMLGVATAFARYVTMAQIPQMVVDFILNTTDNKILIMLMINIFLLMVGCIMDNIPALMILTPILLPLGHMCGLNNIQFGMVICLNTSIGIITPPYGPNLFISSTIAKIGMEDLIKYLLPMLIANIAVLILITYFPAITTFMLELGA